jgi:hypothetical protein
LKKEEIRKGYICGVDFQEELAQEGVCDVIIYPTLEDFKKNRTCWKHGCGIVEVEIKISQWIEPQDFKKKDVRSDR